MSGADQIVRDLAVQDAIDQVREWNDHRDDGWALDREQCTALADEVESLRGRLTEALADGVTLRAGTARRPVLPVGFVSAAPPDRAEVWVRSATVPRPTA